MRAVFNTFLHRLYLFKNILFRKKLGALQGRTDLKYAQPLVLSIFDHPENKKNRPKGFKGRFGHFFNEVKLLVASRIHPHFKLGVLNHLNNELLPKVK